MNHYDLLYLIAGVALAPIWARKRREGWRERFGRVDPLPPSQRPRVLLHAVSVGEVNLIRALGPRLTRDVDVVVSVTTDTGIARARELFENEPDVTIVRYPLDFSRSVRRFLDAVDPDAVGLVELELWPNFVKACVRRGVPIAVLNGRLSDRSVGGYKRFSLIFRPLFRAMAFIAAQDETYAQRFRDVGAAPDRVIVAGSMKWDAGALPLADDEIGSFARRLGIDRARPLIVAGSTAPDEHTLLHQACPPDVQLLCAPRRPEWFDDAARDLPGCMRWSETIEDSEPPSASGRFLLDTIGKLRLAYALADVVIIGRSFGDLHGSDPMEPAGLGKPIVIGPAIADFQDAVAKLAEDSAIVQTTRGELPGVLDGLLSDHEGRQTLSDRALACVQRHAGATERHAGLLLELLGSQRQEDAGIENGAQPATVSTASDLR